MAIGAPGAGPGSHSELIRPGTDAPSRAFLSRRSGPDGAGWEPQEAAGAALISGDPWQVWLWEGG